MRVTIPLLLLALAASACATSRATNPRLSLKYEKDWRTTDVQQEIARSSGKDVSISDLGRTAWVSHHVAVVRTEERPHYHRFHDLTVFVLQGQGTLNVEQRSIEMKPGDVAHVQRGTPHFFRNTGKEPAVAAVVFSPPFDGRDTVSNEAVTPKEGEEEAEEKPRKRGWWPF